MIEVEVVPTHCPFCSVSCGLNLLVGITGKVKQVEPRLSTPINEGALCPKGIDCHKITRHADRLRTPLIKEGEGFRKASWSEALSRIATEFRRIVEESGPQSIGFYAGSRLSNETVYLFKKLASVGVGTTNIDFNDRLGTSSAETAYTMALGSNRAPNPLSDLLLSEVVIILGSNIAACHPVAMKYLFNAKDRGSKIIIVDPRKTQTSLSADIHLQIRPGTDLALLNGMLNLITTNGLLDHNFISKRTRGFDDIQDSLSKYTPKKVAEITGLAEERIVEVAKLYGSSRSAMIIHTRGIEQQVNGVANVMACINLALATGKIGKPGCGCLPIVGHTRGQIVASTNSNDSQKTGVKMVNGNLTALEMFEAIGEGRIQAMYILASNPLVSMPDLNFIKNALNQLKFLVVQDIFLSETSRFAQVILPGASWAESDGTISGIDGRYMKLNKATNPPGEALADWVIICRLAESLGVGSQFNYLSAEDVFNEMKVKSDGSFLTYSGLTYKRLFETDGVFIPYPSEGSIGTPRLYEERFAGRDGLAIFHPVEYVQSQEQTDKDFPFTLITFKDTFHFLTGTQSMRMNSGDMCPDIYLEINPETAARTGISNGDMVLVKNRRGGVKLRAEVTERVLEDSVAIPLHSTGVEAANYLTSRTLDPLSKIPGYKLSRVSIKKLQDGKKIP